MAVTQEGLELDFPVVSLTAALTGDRLEIIVADNGTGMDEATAAQALEPLFSTRGFGVGLGLPIAVQIFSRHGGGLKLYSRPRHGTTVTLWLPAGNSDARQAA
jgi:signal transduction histidine kinase